jgi:mannose-6-phosphate isomerase
VFLPAGTVHGVGGGVLFAEIQQTSDATFRLFDWNRVDGSGQRRRLHVEEGLSAIDWKRGPVEPIRVPRFGAADETPLRKPLVECSYFRLTYLRQIEPFEVGGSGTLEALMVLGGRARIGDEALIPGQVWLMPAVIASTQVRPEPAVSVLHCVLPRGNAS